MAASHRTRIFQENDPLDLLSPLTDLVRKAFDQMASQLAGSPVGSTEITHRELQQGHAMRENRT